jgi:hypothetical protein
MARNLGARPREQGSLAGQLARAESHDARAGIDDGDNLLLTPNRDSGIETVRQVARPRAGCLSVSRPASPQVGNRVALQLSLAKQGR